MEYILGLLGVILGGIGYLFIKKKSAEALLENNEVKSKLNDLDKDKAKNDGLLDAEAEKRKDLFSSAEEKKNNPIDPKDFNWKNYYKN